MRKNTGFFLLALFSFLGCSGVHVKQDYEISKDFSQFKTYAWQTKTQKESSDVRINNSLLNDRIRNAIDASLAANGFNKRDEQSADFAVGYHYLIHHKIDTDHINTFYGFGIGHPFGYSAYGRYHPGAVPYVRSRDYGEIIVDIIDPKNKKLIWRGSATRKLYDSDDPRVTTKRVNETVQAILSKFPPSVNK